MKPLLLGILLLCVASPVFCEEEGKVFTNEDLRKYKKDYGATVYQAPPGRGTNRRGNKEDAGRENASQKKRDYYCSYGTKYKRSMDEAEHALKRCQEKFYEKRKAARFLISEDRAIAIKKRAPLNGPGRHFQTSRIRPGGRTSPTAGCVVSSSECG